jgi:hypothetical protein
MHEDTFCGLVLILYDLVFDFHMFQSLVRQIQACHLTLCNKDADLPFIFIRQQCFSDASSRRPADLMSSFATIKSVMNSLQDGLRDILLVLLKNLDTRDKVLEYLAEVINKNVGRSRMQVTGKLNWLYITTRVISPYSIPCLRFSLKSQARVQIN